MSGRHRHITRWSPPFKGARGDSENHKPPVISASIPNARSSNYLHVSRRSIRSPRPNHFPRRNPLHTIFPGVFATVSPVTDMKPLTRLTSKNGNHRLIVFHRLIVKRSHAHSIAGSSLAQRSMMSRALAKPASQTLLSLLPS